MGGSKCRSKNVFNKLSAVAVDINWVGLRNSTQPCNFCKIIYHIFGFLCCPVTSTEVSGRN